MLLSWPVLERQHQFRVLKWEFGWQLWHWARSSEIMKQMSGQSPNPPRLDAGINGLIKASLFVLVDRFTRNKPNLLYTFPSLACRHLPALAGASALTSVWFGRCWHTNRSDLRSAGIYCVPVGSADFASATVIHWVVWLNIEENNLYITYRRCELIIGKIAVLWHYLQLFWYEVQGISLKKNYSVTHSKALQNSCVDTYYHLLCFLIKLYQLECFWLNHVFHLSLL